MRLGIGMSCVSRFWFCAGMESIGVYVSCDSDKCILWFEDSTLVDV